MSARAPDSETVGVLAPTGRDAALICKLLTEHGFDCRVLSSSAELARDLTSSLALAVVAEEALTPGSAADVCAALESQPPWSDFPFVLMSGHFTSLAQRPAEPLIRTGNVTMLDRPVQTRTLLSSVRAAIRGRQKQYAARRAIEERDRFLAMLGHELRNPLGAILFAAEKMKRVSQGTAEREVATVHRQALLLSRLVDDLLDVSRVTSGKIALAKETLDLRLVAERSVTALAPRAAARALHIQTALPHEPVWALGDADRLDQVMTNLLVNAVKYTPDGGSITVSVGEEKGQCELKVKDTGIGISEESLGRIFDLFAQVDETLDRAQGGLGLGLTLVRTLVELHGGAVEAHSEGVGKGAELVVRLPKASTAPVHGPQAAHKAFAAAHLHIVLIEDNVDIRELLAEMLEEEGHTVHSAADGKRGLKMIIDEAPDLALIDIGLPGLDGYQVAEQARCALGKGVRMIALSGYGQPDDKQRAKEAGFDMHMTKPVDLERLRGVMSEITASRGPVLRVANH